MVWSVLLILACAGSGFADDLGSLKRDVADAEARFRQVDPSLADHFAKAAGYALFPKVGKGGFVFGGAHGRGLVYEKGRLVGEARITQVTFGAQLGGQQFAELIFFETPERMAEFKNGKLALGAHLSAVAAAEGASKEARYVDGVLVFVRATQGLMFEASVGGQKFRFKPIPASASK
jgi:lipid-binding SYLF domain-containing protein